MIFVHNEDKEIFGYYNKYYNYFCKGRYVVDKSSWEYDWLGFIKNRSINQLAPTNLWRW